MSRACDGSKERTNKRNKRRDAKSKETMNKYLNRPCIYDETTLSRMKNQKQQTNLPVLFVLCSACRMRNVVLVSLLLRLFSKQRSTKPQLARVLVSMENPDFGIFQAANRSLKYFNCFEPFHVFTPRLTRKFFRSKNYNNVHSNANKHVREQKGLVYKQMYSNFASGFLAFRGKKNLNFQEGWPAESINPLSIVNLICST